MSARKAYTLTRTHTGTGAVYTVPNVDERRARTSVLNSLCDNLGETRTVANRAANAIRVGEPFTHGHYVFNLERVAS